MTECVRKVVVLFVRGALRSCGLTSLFALSFGVRVLYGPVGRR